MEDHNGGVSMLVATTTEAIGAAMGSVVEYRCEACQFSSGRLSLGWGRAGRDQYWGALALCEHCKELSVIDLSKSRPERLDVRCKQCRGLLKRLEGIAERLPCPQCGHVLPPSTLGSWA